MLAFKSLLFFVTFFVILANNLSIIEDVMGARKHLILYICIRPGFDMNKPQQRPVREVEIDHCTFSKTVAPHVLKTNFLIIFDSRKKGIDAIQCDRISHKKLESMRNKIESYQNLGIDAIRCDYVASHRIAFD